MFVSGRRFDYEKLKICSAEASERRRINAFIMCSSYCNIAGNLRQHPSPHAGHIGGVGPHDLSLSPQIYSNATFLFNNEFKQKKMDLSRRVEQDEHDWITDIMLTAS